jgi:CRISPR-associated protein Cas5d
MLYDMDYSDQRNITPMFFRAALKRGVLNCPAPGSAEVLR